MRSRVGVLCSGISFCLLASPSKGQQIADTFVWPVDITSGFTVSNGFLEVYQSTTGPKHHLGLDENLPGSADFGKSVVAVANGKVVEAKTVNGPDPLGSRVVIKHTLPNGTIIYSRVLHLSKVFVRVGDVVTVGQKIGQVGNSGGYWPSHLHLDLRWSLTQSNPYIIPNAPLNQLTTWEDPSLFIDDRAQPTVFRRATFGYLTFQVPDYTPLAAATIQIGTGKTSLLKAYQAGQITAMSVDGEEFDPEGDSWGTVFEPGHQYSILILSVRPSVLTLYTPSRLFIEERGRRDMINQAWADGMTKVDLNSFDRFGPEDEAEGFTCYHLTFSRVSNGRPVSTIYLHCTYSSNPLWRLIDTARSNDPNDNYGNWMPVNANGL